MSVAYLSEHPSRSFSLRNLGSHLAQWLKANPHFAGRRARLAEDVARIEWAFVEAFDCAEREALTLEQISTLDGDSRLALQPHLRLVALDFPVDELVLNLHKNEKRQTSEAGVRHEDDDDAPAKLPPIRGKATWIAAHRVDFSVYYLRLRRDEFLTLSAIQAGVPLAQAIETGVVSSRVPSAKRPQLVREWFTSWSQLGWICARDIEAVQS
jgi:hypothetical protein